MPGINTSRQQALAGDFSKILEVLAACPGIDKGLSVPPEDFARRQAAAWKALEQASLDVGFVFSDEHYDGDVPYLGGNTNITIEQVAGVIGRNGFHVVAGLEGGYVCEQLAGAPTPRFTRWSCCSWQMKNTPSEPSGWKTCSRRPRIGPCGGSAC